MAVRLRLDRIARILGRTRAWGGRLVAVSRGDVVTALATISDFLPNPEGVHKGIGAHDAAHSSRSGPYRPRLGVNTGAGKWFVACGRLPLFLTNSPPEKNQSLPGNTIIVAEFRSRGISCAKQAPSARG